MEAQETSSQFTTTEETVGVINSYNVQLTLKSQDTIQKSTLVYS